MEGDMRPRTRPGQAQRGVPTLLGAVWRVLSHHLHLLFCRLLLPLCRAAGTAIASTWHLAGHGRRDRAQRERAGGRPERPSAARGAAEPPDCAICLQPCEPGRALKLLSCSHGYHGPCIDRWHRAQPGTKSCPLCLRGVTAVLLGHPGTHGPQQ